MREKRVWLFLYQSFMIATCTTTTFISSSSSSSSSSSTNNNTLVTNFYVSNNNSSNSNNNNGTCCCGFDLLNTCSDIQSALDSFYQQPMAQTYSHQELIDFQVTIILLTVNTTAAGSTAPTIYSSPRNGNLTIEQRLVTITTQSLSDKVVIDIGPFAELPWFATLTSSSGLSLVGITFSGSLATQTFSRLIVYESHTFIAASYLGLESCTFENIYLGDASLIYIWAQVVTITGCTLNNITSHHPNYLIDVLYSTSTITNTEMTDINMTSGDTAPSLNDAVIDQSFFVQNTGPNIISANSQIVLSMNGTVMQNNSATANGGAITASHATINLDRVSILNNVARFFGGGIYAESSLINITSSMVFANSATESGAIALVAGSTLVLSNTSIQQNRASLDGGSITCLYSSVLLDTGNQIILNTASNGLEYDNFGCTYQANGPSSTCVIGGTSCPARNSSSSSDGSTIPGGNNSDTEDDSNSSDNTKIVIIVMVVGLIFIIAVIFKVGYRHNNNNSKATVLLWLIVVVAVVEHWDISVGTNDSAVGDVIVAFDILALLVVHLVVDRVGGDLGEHSLVECDVSPVGLVILAFRGIVGTVPKVVYKLAGWVARAISLPQHIDVRVQHDGSRVPCSSEIAAWDIGQVSVACTCIRFYSKSKSTNYATLSVLYNIHICIVRCLERNTQELKMINREKRKCKGLMLMGKFINNPKTGCVITKVSSRKSISQLGSFKASSVQNQSFNSNSIMTGQSAIKSASLVNLCVDNLHLNALNLVVLDVDHLSLNAL
ncbi:putative membrane-anchored extracellular protein [Cavenderia fasciculata]|uniref:Membrane-anchored extracellular protein n=1 Tax=Cavenderia fasciculata TaxID=261658 RepID=F4Q2U0_CACFS|nr:putative membrane-anchored extracellular protein [Cavenderia fasciculata]EGG16716.1 putative membrane-anchored extracellular protein [Cavenderia fasciculata]|eukprot:XP_004355190.1 putative membrane-anchored extracellular protein [Cavenderia fasciculata]